MATARFPLFMRFGSGAEFEIGVFEFPPDGDGTVTISRSDIAGMFRAAADAFENPEQEDTPDAPA